MFPTSTKSGGAVFAFPDVCTTPTPGAPLPAAYPNVGRSPQTSVTGKVTTTVTVPSNVGVVSKTPTGGTGTLKGMVSTNTSMWSFGAIGSPGIRFEGTAVVPSLRNQLNLLHSKLARLGGSDPNRWHELIDEYVQVTALLYIALAEQKGKVP